jgi:hypothetical protein
LVAQALGVSTTPVRDAIIRLIGVGALVNLGLKTVVVSVLTMVTLDEVTKIRSVLESLAAFEATTHTDDSDIEVFDTTQSQINSATDGEQYGEVLRQGRGATQCTVPFLFVPESLLRKRFTIDNTIDCMSNTNDWIKTEKIT